MLEVEINYHIDDTTEEIFGMQWLKIRIFIYDLSLLSVRNLVGEGGIDKIKNNNK